MTMTAIGTPRVVMHLEAHTEDCICDKLPGCGGIECAESMCTEHGYVQPYARFHTHAQQVDQINRHRRI